MTIPFIVLAIVLGIVSIHLYDRLPSIAHWFIRLAARLEAPDRADIPLLVALYVEQMGKIDSKLDKLIFALRTVLTIGIPMVFIRVQWRTRKMLAACKRAAAVAGSSALNLLLGLVILTAIAVAIGVFIAVVRLVYEKIPTVYHTLPTLLMALPSLLAFLAKLKALHYPSSEVSHPDARTHR